MNVADCPELRDLLLFIGSDVLVDSDIPHRTKLTGLIVENFKREYQRMIDDIQVNNTTLVSALSMC